MNKGEITKEIIIELIEKGALRFDDYPGAKKYTDIVCEAYKQIYNTVSEPLD